MKRKPSCLISWTHCGPDGAASAKVGRHGSMKPGGWRAGAEERQSIAGLYSGRMAGMRIDSCASSGPKKPQCDSNVYWGWGGTEGPDRLNVGWGPHVFWGGGSGRDPALDLYKPQTSTS